MNAALLCGTNIYSNWLCWIYNYRLTQWNITISTSAAWYRYECQGRGGEIGHAARGHQDWVTAREGKAAKMPQQVVNFDLSTCADLRVLVPLTNCAQAVGMWNGRLQNGRFAAQILLGASQERRNGRDFGRAAPRVAILGRSPCDISRDLHCKYVSFQFRFGTGYGYVICGTPLYLYMVTRPVYAASILVHAHTLVLIHATTPVRRVRIATFVSLAPQISSNLQQEPKQTSLILEADL